MGLEAALDSLVRSLRQAGAPEIELAAEGTGAWRLDPDGELALYRIVQEALANAVRHAGASHVKVSLRTGNAIVRAEIEDDGNGFTLVHGDGDGERGMGLVGMRERARNAGGSLKIDSAPGTGTRVSVELPVRRRPG